MKNFKKLVAFGMTMVMMLGSSLSVFATEDTPSVGDDQKDTAVTGSKTGEGTIEGLIPNDVVIVKVSAVDEDYFDITLDPQRLIYESVFNNIEDTSNPEYIKEFFGTEITDPADVPTAYFKKYARTIQEAGVVSENGKPGYTYTNTSTPVYAINKGLNDVNIGLTTAVDLPKGADGKELMIVSGNKANWTATYAEPAVYVGVKSAAVPETVADNSAVDAIDAATTAAVKNFDYDETRKVENKNLKVYNTIDKNVLGMASFQNGGNVTASYNAAGYKLVPATNKHFNAVGFELEAASNPNGVWKSDYLGKKIDVKLTWDLSPKAAATAALTAGGELTLTGLSGSQNFAEMNLYAPNGLAVEKFDTLVPADAWDITAWSLENGGTAKVQLPETWIDYLDDMGTTYIEVKMTDGTTAYASAAIAK